MIRAVLLWLCLCCPNPAAAQPVEQPIPEQANALLVASARTGICSPVNIDNDMRGRLSTWLAGVRQSGWVYKTGLTPLHFAAMADDAGAVRRLLAMGYVLETRDLHGSTALHSAAMSGAAAAVRALLLAGAQVDATTDNGATPLFLAVSQGEYLVARELLAAGADANACLQSGATALQYALVACADTNLVKLLLDNGALLDRQRDRALRWSNP